MLDAETMATILYDIAAGRSEVDSRIKYTEEMRDFRDQAEADWEEYQKAHPGAELVIPSELPREDIKVPE